MPYGRRSSEPTTAAASPVQIGLSGCASPGKRCRCNARHRRARSIHAGRPVPGRAEPRSRPVPIGRSVGVEGDCFPPPGRGLVARLGPGRIAFARARSRTRWAWLLLEADPDGGEFVTLDRAPQVGRRVPVRRRAVGDQVSPPSERCEAARGEGDDQADAEDVDGQFDRVHAAQSPGKRDSGTTTQRIAK